MQLRKEWLKEMIFSKLFHKRKKVPDWLSIMGIYMRQSLINIERFENSTNETQKEHCLELAKLYLNDAIDCYNTEINRRL